MSTNYTPIYSEEVEEALKDEFKDILKDKIYLDHAGATLYSKQQITDIHNDLSSNLFANPHSKSIISKTTEDLIDSVRYQILDFFGTTPQNYSVIFTSGATQALKLVGETFDYKQNGRLVYLEENHTSVLGMREYAPNHESITKKEAFDVFDKATIAPSVNGRQENDLTKFESNINNLFVYPAQCNFSGFKYPLDWVTKTQNGCLTQQNGNLTLKNDINKTENWFCFLDAASFSATNPLDLTQNQTDFVCVSFYKIFGYPTGLGALLIKNSSADVLKKKYFGGGTVFMALANRNVVVHRSNIQEKFEDGTISYLSIAALKHGFAALKRHNLQMSTIKRHVFNLAQYVFNNLKTYRHYNNKPVCVLYHDGDFQTVEKQGGIVNFNIQRADGTWIGFSEIMHVANLFNISLRTGCFCNPGACQRHLGITTEEVQYYFEMGHVCGDQRDLIDGKPTGSVRISFGYMSNLKDADAILKMVKSCFIQTQPELTQKIDKNGNLTSFVPKTIDPGVKRRSAVGNLNKLFIYPIKSCAALEIKEKWRLVSTGMQYDREWMIVNADGVSLTQKHTTKMCLIQPTINLETKQLILSFNSAEEIYKQAIVDLEVNFDSYRCHSKVCGDKIQGWDCGDEVGLWLDDVLGLNGLRLIKQFDRNVKQSITKKKVNNLQNQHNQDVKLSLVNKAQFLLINKASVEWLYQRVPVITDFDNVGDNGEESEVKEELNNSIARFRPNLLVDFGKPFIENDFTDVYIGNLKLTVEGKCTRCQMICIDQSTGNKTVEPLRTLSKELKGKITFGIYLNMDLDDVQNGGWVIAPAMETFGDINNSH